VNNQVVGVALVGGQTALSRMYVSQKSDNSRATSLHISDTGISWKMPLADREAAIQPKLTGWDHVTREIHGIAIKP